MSAGRRASVRQLRNDAILWKVSEEIAKVLGNDSRTLWYVGGEVIDADRLVQLLVSLGPRKARALIDEISRSGAVEKDFVGNLAEVVARVHDLALNPPPQLVDAVTYIIRSMDVRGDSTMSMRRRYALEGVAVRLLKGVNEVVDLADDIDFTMFNLAAGIAAMVSEPAATEGGFLTVRAYDRLIKLGSPLTALRLAANHFWAFEPMAEDILDRITDGVKDAFTSAVGPSGAVTVKRGPLWRQIIIDTTLSDLLGMSVPNNPQVTVVLALSASEKGVINVEVLTFGTWRSGEQNLQAWDLTTSHSVKLPDDLQVASVDGLIEALRRQVPQGVGAVKDHLRDKVIKAAVVDALLNRGYKYIEDENAFEATNNGMRWLVNGDFLRHETSFTFEVYVSLDLKELLGVRGVVAAGRLLRLLSDEEFATAAGAGGLVRYVHLDNGELRIANRGVDVDARRLDYWRARELVSQHLGQVEAEALAVTEYLGRLAGRRGGAKDDLRELGMLAAMTLLHSERNESPLLTGLIYDDVRRGLAKAGFEVRRGRLRNFYLTDKEVVSIVKAANIKFEPDGTITINGKTIEGIIRNHTAPEVPEGALRRMVSDAYAAVINTVFVRLERIDGSVVDEVMKGSRITAGHIAKINHDDRRSIPLTPHLLRYADDEAAVEIIRGAEWDDDVLSVLGSGDAAVEGRLDKLVDAALRRHSPTLSTRVALRFRKEVLSGIGEPKDDGVWVDTGKYLAQVAGLNGDGTYTFLIYPKDDSRKVYGIAYRARNLREALEEADRTIDREQWLLSLLLDAGPLRDMAEATEWHTMRNYYTVRLTLKDGATAVREFYGPHARRMLMKSLVRAPGPGGRRNGGLAAAWEEPEEPAPA